MNNFECSEQSATVRTSEAENTNEKDLVYYGTKDVARMLRCSLPKAQEIMKRKDFPSLEIGRKFLVVKEAFLQWSMQKRTDKPSGRSY